MYTLVNVPTLVRDLARSARAAAVATDLLRAFRLDADAVAVLDELVVDAPARAASRERVRQGELDRPRALPVLRATRSVAGEVGGRAWSAALDLLEQAALGGLDDLTSFVRNEVVTCAWEGDTRLRVLAFPRALDVVADGVAGAYADDATLAAPWRAAVTDLDLRPATSPWPAVVEGVGALTASADVPPAPAEWAARMHEACWAVHLTGRGRDAAVTQLHALRALVAAVGPQPPLRTVAMTVAAVHATVVADVLDTTTYDAMTQPLFRLVA